METKPSTTTIVPAKPKQPEELPKPPRPKRPRIKKRVERPINQP